MNATTTNTPDTSTGDEAKNASDSRLAAAQESVSHAAEATRKAVGDATTKTVDAAKGHPATAAAIAVGAVAAVAGAAYGASKLLKSDKDEPKTGTAKSAGTTKTTKAKA